MLKLIKNELYKIIHKKSTFIMIIIVFLYAILVSYFYSKSNSFNYANNYYEDLSYYEEIINKYENEDNHDSEYIYAKTIMDAQEFMKNFSSDDWRSNFGYNEYFMALNSYYETDDAETKEKLEEVKKALLDNNWQYFVNKNIEEEKTNLNNYKNLLEKETNENKIYEYKKEIYGIEANLYTLNYRLKENLCYGTDYLNEAIDTYVSRANEAFLYENEKENKEYEVLASEFYKSKYILDNKIDVNSEETLRAIVINFFEEYRFLILIFCIMIAGGIVSEEFNKGTIKSLLTIPYKRTTIIASKFITTMLIIPLFILVSFIIQLVVGGLFLGFSSLSIPYITFNFTTSSLEVINVFWYFILLFITNLPMIILLTTLAFAASSIINNTAFSIAITLCGYIGSSLVNGLALSKDVTFILKYFVTPNWDLTPYLFGGSSMYGNSLNHAIIVCGVYFLIMVVASFWLFKIKDIKNI